MPNSDKHIPSGMVLSDAPINSTKTMRKYKREYNRVWREMHGREKEYAQRKNKRSERYLLRPFVAWDGEGYNDDNGVHHYAILANSTGHSIANEHGISTVEAFDFLLDEKTSGVKDAIHIIYGGSYDFNMMMRDIPRAYMEELYKTGEVEWNGYYLRWRIAKSLTIQQNERKITIYDVLPFFQCTFVNACDLYLGTDWQYREQIIAEKKRRGSFTWEEITDGVADYNRAELVNLVLLAIELRNRLDRVGIRISRWDGPGAIAVSLFQTHGTKEFMAECPEAVNDAARYAYSGGRFEIILQGHTDQPVYEYDINSAYPAAIRNLPCLAHGKWTYVPGRDIASIDRFALYHIRSQDNRSYPSYENFMSRVRPLWHRNPDGTVVYNDGTTNWYWTPEAELVFDDPDYEFLEAWVWEQTCDHVPFDWVEPMYLKRAALKKAGDGAHMGLKLGLNSLYGKLAQQVGARYVKGKWIIPPYHQIEWAGFITASCRAMVYQAAQHAPGEIIAFETDALFSRVPLRGLLPISNRLGEWEETIFDNITYIKSGFYYADCEGKPVERSRGFNRGTVPRISAIDALLAQRDIKAEHTTFVTIGAALHTMGWDNWRKWLTRPRNVQTHWWGGKRTPFWENDRTMYYTFPTEPIGQHSTQYAVAWKTEQFYNTDQSVLDFKREGFDDEQDE